VVFTLALTRLAHPSRSGVSKSEGRFERAVDGVGACRRPPAGRSSGGADPGVAENLTRTICFSGSTSTAAQQEKRRGLAESTERMQRL